MHVLLLDWDDCEHGKDNVSGLESQNLPQCDTEKWRGLNVAPIFALSQVWDKFCQYFCTEDILDLCDVNSLPGMDDWNSDKPHGMFWRMQV